MAASRGQKEKRKLSEGLHFSGLSAETLYKGAIV
jgi:hypothetical protein